MAERLTDGQIAKIAQKLSVKQLTLAAVIYMGADFNVLENIQTTNIGNDQEMIRTIIRKWNNRTEATVQNLADILGKSGLVDSDVITGYLGVDPQPLPDKIPSLNPKVEQWQLAGLAQDVRKDVMKRAIMELETLTDDQIANIQSDNPGNSSFQSFELLIKWSIKTDGTRQKLQDALCKDDDTDRRVIKKWLGEISTSAPADIADGGVGVGRYNMDTTPKGIVLIFNNKTFAKDADGEPWLSTRDGTDADVTKLRETFTNIGFKVEDRNDCTAEKMRTEVKEFAANVVHNNTSAAVIVFLSHGNNGSICAHDVNGKVKIDDIIDEFTSDSAPNLMEKPKLFLIQACRGSARDYSTDSEHDMEVSQDYKTKNEKNPRYSDMIVGYATNPGLVSTRGNGGSIYIQTFCEVLSELRQTEDINGIFTQVCDRVAKMDITYKGKKHLGTAKQLPEVGRNTLRKKWFF